MKRFHFALLAMVLLVSMALAMQLGCGDDDDDDDDNDDDNNNDDNNDDNVVTGGACYAQCNTGCIVSSSCLAGGVTEADCPAWAEQSCTKEGCALEASAWAAGCDACDECADAPTWWE
jgi:hypothetical protein